MKLDVVDAAGLIPEARGIQAIYLKLTGSEVDLVEESGELGVACRGIGARHPRGRGEGTRRGGGGCDQSLLLLEQRQERALVDPTRARHPVDDLGGGLVRGPLIRGGAEAIGRTGLGGNPVALQAGVGGSLALEDARVQERLHLGGRHRARVVEDLIVDDVTGIPGRGARTACHNTVLQRGLRVHCARTDENRRDHEHRRDASDE